MKKAYVFLIDGFEEIEAIATIDVLRRAEVETVTVSLDPSRSVKGGHDIVVEADVMFDDADWQEADMLILPGGNVGSKKMLEHQALHKTLTEAANAGKYVAAICAATMTLGKTGLVSVKKATCYPGVEEHLTGADVTAHENVVVDGNIITSRGPAPRPDRRTVGVTVFSRIRPLKGFEGKYLLKIGQAELARHDRLTRLAIEDALRTFDIITKGGDVPQKKTRLQKLMSFQIKKRGEI
ncbi:DJ-1 family glyoxalase III [Bacillus licheniformis]|uniref:DJ-1 family glyoxalase III n=1 Tax=Bacillus licheniformis TaxID=1402 RepID=UPI00227FE1F4|nr:DJ-1 family glyoxalase III [Bacillus licheniformis]MCY7773625.1 DJ-1/PfpI family protein [Bacillus licheniformis]